MKVLDMLSDVFDKLPRPRQSIKGFINEQRKDNTGTDAEFFYLMIQYLGGRSYNRFLDYSLLAIKLNDIHDKHCFLVPGTSEDIDQAVTKLLNDDRHDLWQNLPYYLEDITKAVEEKHGADKVKAFWFDVVGAVVDCINVRGTGDVSVNFTIEEE